VPDLSSAVRRSWRWLLLNERTQMAVKAAVAASLAWLAASLVGDRLDAYRYYAPLGAVIATYPTVATSVRQSVRAVAAITLGGALGLAVHAALQPSLLTLALVVAAGVLVGSLPFLGDMRGYVPIVALFVLVIGGNHAWLYALAYALLALMGAMIGTAVSLAFPALRLTKGRDAVQRLQSLVADQLADLADGLAQDPPPSEHDWRRRQRRLPPVVAQMREAVLEARDAQRGNPRARFHRAEAERQRQVAQTLERVAVLVEDLIAIIVDTYRDDRPASPIDRELAGTVARALQALATLVRAYDADLPADDGCVAEVEDALRALTAAFAERRDLDPADVAVLGAVVANLRRCLTAVDPRPGDA
jgi:uncharacterized membrane protein YgaE (UPF0421/DUF939 family)